MASVLTQDQNFELARLYFDRCEFDKSINHFKFAAEEYYRLKNFEQFLECQRHLLRMYAESDQSDQIQKIKEKLQDLVLKEGLELSSKTYYTLALCLSYRGQPENALEYLQKALAIALAADNKVDMCYAILGIAICYQNLGKVQEALQELYNLKVFFQVIQLPDLQIAADCLNAQILSDLKNYDDAIPILWQAYEKSKEARSIWYNVFILFLMGEAYLGKGEKEMARVYFSLSEKSCAPSLLRMQTWIRKAMGQLGYDHREQFDLVFELADNAVVERRLGKVDFKNQFILLDLLKLFVQNQGSVYSKESLVEKVWKQKYNPEIHDNKIYVTIKRLRRLIEPDFDKPKYIFRAKNGYYMNKSARVLLDSKSAQGGL